MVKYRDLKKRIERDKARKASRKTKQYDNYDEVVSMQHLVSAWCKCQKGVSFKYSVQHYNAHAIENLNALYHQLKNQQLPKMKSCKQEVIRERGKERVITPISIEDRVPQRMISDYALVPMLQPKVIYDNGASMAGKGVSFSRKRLEFEKAKRWYGDDFYVLQFDFKSFFDSVPHALCERWLRKTFTDERIIDITMQIIRGYKPDGSNKGICLGSQVSQMLALVVANDIDHYFKDKRRIKLYCRYMDDGVMFVKTKAEAHQLLKELSEIVTQNGLVLNVNKTHIVHVRHGFTFLKTKYVIRNQQTIKRLTHASIVRMRRKLKAFKVNPKITDESVYNSIQSWANRARQTKSFRSQKHMFALYHELFNPPEKWRLKAA